ncbi:catalase family peroxidase [Streptomyces sp. NBC_00878]|uniref:catalase family peroxidase n=1 Tax=Streptomyces sp. NBC_00878 TaxID=2975854 RepID=UPI00225B2517|nr:catalase family peroxidase [Streptomyces sp. NBC_00878]MCX4911141.1 catalase family peroxidase [Streptomyces sp. NBC_00878]
MPSSSAEQTLAVQVVDSMERMSGKYPGHRRSSARGACFRAMFTPTGAAAALTTAAHLQEQPVPATVRFSNSEGNPHTPDTAAVTRGMATRFHLPDGGDTDLIALTVARFVASTPQEFLELTEALRPDPVTQRPDLDQVYAFVEAHPHLAEAAAQQPPIPVSYATAAYWAIHAFIWVDADGARQAVRYRWEPAAGRIDLTARDAATRTDHYLTDELHQRLEQAPVAFNLRIQLAEPDDPTHNPTIVWPDQRKEITAGRLEITAPADDQDLRDTPAFNPTRVTTGIQLSDDPILAFRAHAYAESHLRRSHNQ